MTPDEVGRLLQVVVLTDGETSGEAACRELAREAWEKRSASRSWASAPNGTAASSRTWPRSSDGRWYYIDAEQTDEAMRVFLAEFDRLADTLFVNVVMERRPVKDVKVKRIRQVTPQIREIPLTQVDERLVSATLGTLERSHPAKYIVDLSLPRRPDGKYVVAQVEVKYDLGDGEQFRPGPCPWK